MSPLDKASESTPDIPLPTITLNPAPRNEKDALDFQQFILYSPQSQDGGIAMIRNVGVKVEDQLRTPPPQFILPMTPVQDDGSLPFLPTLNTPRDTATIHLEARGSNAWHFHGGPNSASPRDVVAESHAAYIHETIGCAMNDKKAAREENDYGDLRRAWPLEDERDGCRYIEDAPSDASSLSSSPWEMQADTSAIFRTKSKSSRPNSPGEWPRSSVRYDADSQKKLQRWIHSAPPLCVSTSDCSSTSSCCENDDAMSYAPTKHDHNYNFHNDENHNAYLHQDTADVEKSTAGRGRRLREAFELLIEVFTPECCAPHMRVGSRPGVLKPWHVLVPATHAPQRQVSSTRLRGCYL